MQVELLDANEAEPFVQSHRTRVVPGHGQAHRPTGRLSLQRDQRARSDTPALKRGQDSEVHDTQRVGLIVKQQSADVLPIVMQHEDLHSGAGAAVAVQLESVLLFAQRLSHGRRESGELSAMRSIEDLA